MTSFIDHVFYINLEKRKDRRNEIENELEKMGLIHQVERFNAILSNPGSVGCGLSHYEVLKTAKERGYKNILILEDDFTFLVDKDTFEKNCKLFFENIKEYNVCMLSYNCQRSKDIPEFPFIKKTLEVQTTSGYLVNESFYETLMGNFEQAVINLKKSKNREDLYSIDQYWKILQETSLWYQFSTRIGKQRPSYSDIIRKKADYNV